MLFKTIGFAFLLGALIINMTSAGVRFTNIRCTELDREFAQFEYCLIKAVNRTYKYFSLKVKLLKVPITNVTVNYSFLKRANGYKPFLYNVTFDICEFFRGQKVDPVKKYIYELFRSHSNINHTCPYDHDLIVEKIDISYVDNRVTNILPMPRGEYAFDSNWYAYNINRANVRIYAELF